MTTGKPFAAQVVLHRVNLSLQALSYACKEPARTSMLGQRMCHHIVLDSRTRERVGELARAASVTAQTTSEHLAKLRSAGLIEAIDQGRHRYFRLASEQVGIVVETLATIAPRARALTPYQPRIAQDLRSARLCFGHLAGALGVGLSRALVERRILRWCDAGYEVTEDGWQWLESMGLDLRDIRARKRAVRTCHVDWSERRPHVAGAFGRALAGRLLAEGHLARVRESRAVRITSRGARWLAQLGLSL